MPHIRCKKVDDYYLLRDGALGIFLAASEFPKNRETRPPLVEEILTIKDQLDPKIRFLANAPVTDSSGNKAQIRYSRKSKEQYVMTEVDKKPTGWKAFYRNGKWVTEVKERRHVKARKKAAKGKKTVKKESSSKTIRKKSSGKAVTERNSTQRAGDLK